MSTFKDLLTAANTIEENNLHKNEKIPEVIAAFKKCYDLDPSNEETKRKYLSYFKRQFELEHIKKNQEELKVLGNAQIQQDRYEEAVIIYNASIDLDPSIESAAPIYSNRSLAFFNLGRFKEAEDDGCMAIFLKPEFARGYLRRGNAAMKLEKCKESLEAYEKYFELDPENAKNDPELVKNKNFVKRAFEQSEAEMRRHQRLMVKTRAELMAIEDEAERKIKATRLMTDQLKNVRSFDVDLTRVLIECGADLALWKVADQHLLTLQRTMFSNSREEVPDCFRISSFLIVLLYTRREVSPKILPQFDELLFFVIDEMLRRDIPFVGWELSLACKRLRVGPVNPKILRALLETNKFDVNRSISADRHTPLISLAMGMMDSAEMPREAPDCLHLLLNWKGIDVNGLWRIEAPDNSSLEVTALGVTRHLEVAKILIRYGANVNAATSFCGAKWNIFDQIFNRPYNSDREELVRLLIHSGARLLPSGRGGKSSMTFSRILGGVTNTQTKKKAFVSEEVLQMILQLNLHQGLLFRWQDPATAAEMPFLLCVILGAPPRFVELLCAMTPHAMKETATSMDSEAFTVACMLANRIKHHASSFEESMQVLGVLLDRGLGLLEPESEYDATTKFALIWNACQEENQDLNLLKKTIIDKRGEAEFEQCMTTFPLKKKITVQLFRGRFESVSWKNFVFVLVNM